MFDDLLDKFLMTFLVVLGTVVIVVAIFAVVVFVAVCLHAFGVFSCDTLYC